MEEVEYSLGVRDGGMEDRMDTILVTNYANVEHEHEHEHVLFEVYDIGVDT